jgi:hypothetical protein
MVKNNNNQGKIKVDFVQKNYLNSVSTFPFSDTYIFVGPGSESSRKRPPKEVIEYFKKNVEFFKSHGEPQEYTVKDWTWHLNGDWNKGHYMRKHMDQSDIIYSHIDKYFDNLSEKINLEINKEEITPKLQKHDLSKNVFKIPETPYVVFFEDGTNVKDELEHIVELQLFLQQHISQKPKYQSSLGSVGYKDLK